MNTVNSVETNTNVNITIKFEHLKNILLKYLEALAQGDQSTIKTSEKVMFDVLDVSKLERKILEEKRLRSSFYYSLWYNARNFITTKIYGGTTSMDDSYSPSSNRSNQFSNLNIEERTSSFDKSNREVKDKEKVNKDLNDTFSNENFIG